MAGDRSMSIHCTIDHQGKTALATFFKSVVKHRYIMPHCLRDCILVQGIKIPCSQTYRVIALGSSLSKVLTHLIINKYSSYLATFLMVLCSEDEGSLK